MFSCRSCSSSFNAFRLIIKKSANRLRLLSASQNFVPSHEPAQEEDLDDLCRLLARAERLVVLTGAGVSTESGIPDYRSQGVGLYSRDKSRRPIQLADFLSSPAARQRYWARNFVAWPRFSSAEPNSAHLALRRLEQRRFGDRMLLVTQNVDALHSKAGSGNVVQLHGTAYQVRCMICDRVKGRHELQDEMRASNAHFQASHPAHDASMAPDGDVLISDDAVRTFAVPRCDACGGVLKPDVVFFGGTVPRATVDAVYARVRACDALLVAGSSLQVYSGYRFVLEAAERNVPVAIVNVGPTRADRLARCKVNSGCGRVLRRVAERVVDEKA